MPTQTPSQRRRGFGDGARAAEVPGILTGSSYGNGRASEGSAYNGWRSRGLVLRHEVREVLWHRALDTELLTRVRMGEGEGGGVEQGAIRLIGSFRAVQPVPENGVADVGEVNSNLVRSSGDQLAADG